eukprot:1317178-Pyramimonas_sp.AAC.1
MNEGIDTVHMSDDTAGTLTPRSTVLLRTPMQTTTPRRETQQQHQVRHIRTCVGPHSWSMLCPCNRKVSAAARQCLSQYLHAAQTK